MTVLEEEPLGRTKVPLWATRWMVWQNLRVLTLVSVLSLLFRDKTSGLWSDIWSRGYIPGISGGRCGVGLTSRQWDGSKGVVWQLLENIFKT